MSTPLPTAPEAGSTAALQVAFAAHLRDPDRVAAPDGLDDRRVAVYRELVFNTIEDLLASNFPVLRSLHDTPAWLVLVRAFLRDHRSHTPLFTEVAREFIRFLETRAVAAAGDPEWFVELAHYEWSELGLMLDTARVDEVAHDPEGDVVDGVPVVSPLARLLAYRFPVHAIGPAFRPSGVPDAPTLIVLSRDGGDEVRFLEVEPLTAMLFERLVANTELAGGACLDRLLDELGRDDEALRAAGRDMLRGLAARGVVIGTRPATQRHGVP